MKVDFEKIGIISSYFAENVNNLYVTKLLKLFYYVDFISYNRRGSSVTGDIYFKLPYGPVPTTIKNEIDLLINSDLEGKYKSQLSKFINLKKDKDEFGRRVINNSKNCEINKLAPFERNLIKSISTEFKQTKASVISEKTHREKPWQLTSNNSVIDYSLANSLNIENILPNFK
ncbi:SocA family protein [Patescibacteria group bacterium]|nr:SocA family protein [Patescibacteria group bacterium]